MKAIGRAPWLCAAPLLVAALTPGVAQERPKADLGTSPEIRAPSLDASGDTAPKSPAEIESDALGPPVKTKTFRIGPDGKRK